MEKYKRAMRNVLRMFNHGKRVHDLKKAISAIDNMNGIMLVAMADDQFSSEDYAKMAHIYGAMLKKMWDI